VATQRYWPYGSTRSGGVTQTDKLYTGQQQEPGDALGLYNYRARFYSTTIGRFVSGDSVVIGQSEAILNRYAYVRNIPTRHTDPSGHCVNSDGCSPGEITTILHCALEARCVPAAPLEDMMRLSWWVVRTDEFYYTTRGLAAVSEGFRTEVQSIRFTETWRVETDLDYYATLARVEDVYLIPARAAGRATVLGYEISYSYFDVSVVVTGEVKTQKNAWWEFWGVRLSEDLSLRISGSVGGRPFTSGPAVYGEGDVWRSSIDFRQYHDVRFFTELTVDQSMAHIVLHDGGSNHSPTLTYWTPY